MYSLWLCIGWVQNTLQRGSRRRRGREENEIYQERPSMRLVKRREATPQEGVAHPIESWRRTLCIFLSTDKARHFCCRWCCRRSEDRLWLPVGDVVWPTASARETERGRRQNGRKRGKRKRAKTALVFTSVVFESIDGLSVKRFKRVWSASSIRRCDPGDSVPTESRTHKGDSPILINRPINDQ